MYFIYSKTERIAGTLRLERAMRKDKGGWKWRTGSDREEVPCGDRKSGWVYVCNAEEECVNGTRKYMKWFTSERIAWLLSAW